METMNQIEDEEMNTISIECILSELSNNCKHPDKMTIYGEIASQIEPVGNSQDSNEYVQNIFESIVNEIEEIDRKSDKADNQGINSRDSIDVNADDNKLIAIHEVNNSSKHSL